MADQNNCNKNLVESIKHECENVFSTENGWEVYPFKVGWYNDLVDKPFVLNYDDETLGMLLISAPRMFDKVFLPWLRDQFIRSSRSVDIMRSRIQDPLDQCLEDSFDAAKTNLNNNNICTSEIVTIHYFDMHPNRRPKLLMNTLGHAAGAAYYYRAPENLDATMEQNKKFLGLSLHPKYGGWFSFRGAFLFPETRAYSLVQNEPIKLLKSDAEIMDALKKFNYNWQDNRFRDAVPTVEQYSDAQREYFSNKPSDRWKVIEKWFASSC